MEIRLNKEWVIYSSKNDAGIILGQIPEKQQDGYVNADKFAGRKYYYATIFGAAQGAFKYGVNNADATSFLEVEKTIERIAQECQSAFSTEQLKVLQSEQVQDLKAEIEILKAQLKKKVPA
ncbi:MAG: hypothetical protein RSA22_07660 [Acinetobacter sp.]